MAVEEAARKTGTKPLLLLLLFVPASFAAALLRSPASWQFALAALGLLPLSGLLGQATEDIARRYGSTVGGLLNATFGNATELIFCFIALLHNDLDVVRASLIGSIIGNVLLVLGLSALLGGLKHHVLTFNAEAAQAHSTMMALSVISLLAPALLVRNAPAASAQGILHLSMGVGAVLMLVYCIHLVFSLRTHEWMFRTQEEERETPVWPRWLALCILTAVTLGIAAESELLVRSLHGAVASWGLSRTFVGLIVVPIIGNAAEHSAAVWMALKDKMDVSLNIAVSSSTQISMFVTPLLIFAGAMAGHPMSILFSTHELIALTVSVIIAMLISSDGKSHWLEGVQLLAVYFIIALSIYYVVH